MPKITRTSKLTSGEDLETRMSSKCWLSKFVYKFIFAQRNFDTIDKRMSLNVDYTLIFIRLGGTYHSDGLYKK